ncbi:DUF2742 domain-containing protein [Mycolicibacterium sp. 050232]|uniref:DUF2742 domain-containing protein n=1 Tax=Mycolicibacterium sp. 050232 TaxID=3113982 RepID=UPI002E2A2CA5|nr:DUF2742 domain-containing protein [Mycolicibacterium sp. 050232]MED5812933.1 DUF2742 domain-containing protein [Mycolicibacterium sp. 050232]
MTDPVGSREVAWWPFHEWIQPYLDTAGDYPPAGTPAWCALSDNDRRKWAAALDAAQHHVLRVETAQAAKAEAAQSISAAADWAGLARSIRSGIYIPRKAS